MLKTSGIPMWVTIYALIVFGFGFVLGLVAMVGQGIGGMDPSMNVSWGGRHMGLGLAAGLAVCLKSPRAYIVVLLGGVCRDLGDLIGHLTKPDGQVGIIIGVAVFLVAGVWGTGAAIKARRL